MEFFINKIGTACDDLNNLYLKTLSPNFQGNSYIRKNLEVNRILTQYFSSNNDLERHLINYFLLISRERKRIGVSDGKYWLFRSAIASLSKYFRPSIDILMTQYYERSLIILEHELNKSITESSSLHSKIIHASDKINQTIKINLGFNDDQESQEKCKAIMKLSLISLADRMKNVESTNAYSLFKEFSTCLIKTIITNTDIPIL